MGAKVTSLPVIPKEPYPFKMLGFFLECRYFSVEICHEMYLPLEGAKDRKNTAASTSVVGPAAVLKVHVCIFDLYSLQSGIFLLLTFACSSMFFLEVGYLFG